MVCIDVVAMDIYWVSLPVPLPSQSSFHVSSLLHLLPSSATPPSFTLAEAADENSVWLTADGHTHLLLGLGDETLSVVTTLTTGLPLVGVLDDSGAGEAEMVDVRLDAGLDQNEEKRELVLSYYKDGDKEVGGVYGYVEPRGRPVMVRVFVPMFVGVVYEENVFIGFGAAVHGLRPDGGLSCCHGDGR